MAKIKSNLSLDEHLIQMDSEIEAAENQLAALRNKKAELEKQVKMARKEFISSRGLSTGEVNKL